MCSLFSALNQILDQISTGEVFNKECSSNDIDSAALALLKLLLDAKKLRLSERDFVTQITTQTSFREDAIATLWEFLLKEPSLSALLTTDEYRFRDLEWRLEAKVCFNFKSTRFREKNFLEANTTF